MFSIQKITNSALVGIALLAFTACEDKVVETLTYQANVPVYKSKTIIRASVESSEAKSLSGAGKIHIRGHHIYIVDNLEGIHIIDNSNPSAPVNAGYIKVPGVIDIASSGNILYADSYTDLVSIDISNPFNVSVVDREEDVFQPILPPIENTLPVAELDESRGFVVGWKVEKVEEVRELDNYGGPYYYTLDAQSNSTTDVIGVAEMDGGSPLSAAPGVQTKSGSMARFTAYLEALYVVKDNDITTFNITNPSDPVEGSTTGTNRVVETIFPMDGKLFIGTTTGMLIYDLTAPLSPTFISAFDHATNCDPVVVEGDYAYVTLRTGTRCGGWQNQLDVVDISNIQAPQLVRSYEMTNPHGLGIDDGTLFICDGDDGLKVYNATDPHAIDQNMLGHFQNINTFDVIPLGEVLLMIGNDGLYQYDYTDPTQVSLLSIISTQ